MIGVALVAFCSILLAIHIIYLQDEEEQFVPPEPEANIEE